MVFRLGKKQGTCCYEEWDYKTKKMVECGTRSKIKVGNKHICREHLDFSLSMDSNAEPKGKDNHDITKADFIRLVDGCIHE